MTYTLRLEPDVLFTARWWASQSVSCSLHVSINLQFSWLVRHSYRWQQTWPRSEVLGRVFARELKLSLKDPFESLSQALEGQILPRLRLWWRQFETFLHEFVSKHLFALGKSVLWTNKTQFILNFSITHSDVSFCSKVFYKPIETYWKEDGNPRCTDDSFQCS